jgi:hypothetical protein
MAMLNSFWRRRRASDVSTIPATVSPSPASAPKAVLVHADKAALRDKYQHYAITDFATVRDFCDSADWLPDLMRFDGDLKDVQRPWTVKAILAHVPPGARLAEIGGGEPVVAAALAELGYEVTVVDPYDGAGNGPTEYEQYVRQFPSVKLVKERFGTHLPWLEDTFDAVYSVSVLEHLPADEIAAVFAGMQQFLRRGGHSIHCIDSVIAGNDTAYHDAQCREILRQQALLAGGTPEANEYDRLLTAMHNSTETFYLSAQGHQQWRQGLGLSYEQFPFRQVVSVQTCAQRV